MMKNRWLRQWTFAAAALLIVGSAVGAAPTPDGSIAFTPLDIKTGAGAKLEQAVVTYQGQSYEVRLNGLGIGGALATAVKVTGEVYGLSKMADLEDTYVTEMVQETVDETSAEILWLHGSHGVNIRLQTSNPEITIAPGGDSVTLLLGRGD